MRRRSAQLALSLAVALLAIVAARPYIERAFVTAPPRSVQPRGSLSDIEFSTITIFERVSPSVVQVAGRTATPGPFAEGGGNGAASGTGFIWDAAGHVVTNDHVVQGTNRLAVRLATGEVLEAELVGAAPNYDLAVIRIKSAIRLPAAVALGSSADLKVGQSAFAIGNPFGLDQSLSSGIISALKRRLPTSSGREIANVIQTDAAINPGNSGGPLLDSAGRVIGVTTAIISPSGANSGIGFAIPVDVVNQVIPQIIQNGRIPNPGIGIIAANEAVATRLGLEGVVVFQVAPGSPAARAGLEGVSRSTGAIGDVIIEADGKQVRRLLDLIEAIEKAGVGRSIEVTALHDGRTKKVRIEIVDIGGS